MKQGDVYLSAPSPITGERELRVIVSSDAYNTRPGCVSVLVAEIETGTRLRPTQHGILTDYGVVLADRIIWFPSTWWASDLDSSVTGSEARW